MSAPLVWIVLPAVCSIILWLFRARQNLVNLVAVLFSLLLAVVAWVMPIGQVVTLGSWRLQITPALEFFGRRLVLDNNDRPALSILFLICVFWFIGNRVAKTNPFFNAMALGIVALLVAAQAVEPFLYAALLVEMAVLLSVPAFAPPGESLRPGVLRFLIFQMLAMPFILLAGWALAQVEANPTNTTMMALAIVFFGLGFAFWLAVFPFYSWVPMLSEQGHPYISGFVFLVFLTVNMLLGLKFIDRFGWLRLNEDLFTGLRLMGMMMIGTAGVLAAFQKDLARLFGYAVLVESGFSLMALGLNSQLGNQLFAAMLLPRVLSFGLWALALSMIRNETGSTSFSDVLGISNRLPVVTAGLAVASLSVAGLPLFAAFPIRLILMEQLAQQSLLLGMAALVGSVGVMFGVFRGLAVLARASISPQTINETRAQILLMVGASVALLLVGLLPQFFLPLMFPIMQAYPGLP